MHERTAAKQYDQYERDPETRARYNGQWRKIRASYIAEHPLCEMCKQAGRLTAAQEVHHKLPLSEGGTHDWQNLAALCTSCHSRLTLTATRHGQ